MNTQEIVTRHRKKKDSGPAIIIILSEMKHYCSVGYRTVGNFRWCKLS